MNAIFITFEGGDGTGKSTQVQLLAETLTSLGIPNLVTREPGGTAFGNAIRTLLVEGSIDKCLPMTELLLHTAIRVEHVNKVIRPALNDGRIVICDRYLDSTIAYQGYGHGLDMDLILMLHNVSTGGLMPDITFVLSTNPDISNARTASRNSKENRYESMGDSFRNRVRHGFDNVTKLYSNRCMAIDTDRPPLSIKEEICSILVQKCGLSLTYECSRP
jgi:dTMP kinase